MPFRANLWRRIVEVILSAVALAALVLVVVIWRGFRAIEPPSRVETAIARKARNLGIPKRDRNAQNPFPHGSDAVEQGRVLFVSHCAVCHGIDGSGKTRIGTQEYPRVPDLRQSPTQELTDGQIHYIIEDGVRFTGMPALATVHRASSEDAWKLVLFIRSLRPLSGQEKASLAHTMATAHYVGSEACATCHRDIYERWKRTPMANIVRDPPT